jgi:hypothetical protein
MSQRKIYKHLKRNWKLTDQEEIKTSDVGLSIQDFERLTATEQRDVLRRLHFLGFVQEANKFRPHLKKFN